ncbi:MAG: SulP family inorganic anion transporter [Planctomycetales bacterium]|nr:SulP family inorganic anion transporter [Planctomycetales bacterium]
MSSDSQTPGQSPAPAKPKNGPGLFSAPRQDFMASIVVFLVALPLCMGIAIASGVPVSAGLITGIIGGLVVGALAGAPLQVSGPAAGLTVIVYEIVQRFGIEMLGLVVLMAGLLQLVAGVLRLGQWFRAVSPAVIKGMLAGIGVLIFASQFHVMVDDTPKGSGLQNLMTIPSAIGKALALPEIGAREDRDLRTEIIHRVGDLHHRQETMAARVAEVLPDHATKQQLELEPETQIAAETAALTALAGEQQAIVADLDQLTQELAAFEESDKKNERRERIRRVSVAAHEKLVAAHEDLEQGRLRTAVAQQTVAVAALSDLTRAVKNHELAAQIGIITIAIIVLWQVATPKSMRVIPAPLVAVVAAAALASGLALPVLYVEVPDSLASEVHFPTVATLLDAPWIALIQAAFVIAAVASAETLLCATAVDQMHQGQRTKYDKELAAQGVGNILCGFLGALPMTGVIVRSSANIQSGGQTRLSAILHGMWLLLFVAALGFLLRLIPTAALAAMLVYTGYKLMDLKSIRKLREYGWGEVAIYAATVTTIVAADLLTGVLVGLGLAAAKLLYRLSHLVADLETSDDGRRATLNLHGTATFVGLPKLAAALERVPDSAELHVDFQHLDYIDHACLEMLMTWAKQHESTQGTLVIDWESLHARFGAERTPRGRPNGDAASPAAASVKGTQAVSG